MKTKFLVILTANVLCVGGFIAFNSRAADAGAVPRREFGQGALLERAKEKLGLTDDQVAQIKAVIEGDKDNLTGLLTRLHEARTGLRAAIQADNASESVVRAAAAKVAAVEADGAVERMKLFQKISPILTTEQRTKLGELESQMDGAIGGAINRFGEKAEAP